MKKINPHLSAVCLGNRISKDSLDTVASMLMDEYKKKNGKILGYAANQLSWDLPIFLIKWHDKTVSIIHDPEIMWSWGNKKSNEGCESLGPNRYIVTRPRLCKVRYYEYDLEDKVSVQRTRLLFSQDSRRFMHEYDHLCGTTIKDKGELYRWNSIYLGLKKQHT